MAVVTYEGIVEGGQIRLNNGTTLPEQAKVYVIVPDAPPPAPPRITTPRLARSDQVADFELEVREATEDAAV